jgi:hypothetical protein
MGRSIIAAMFAALAVVAQAHAAPDEAAYAAYVAGDYETAAERALQVESAENFALAARALNALAYHEYGKQGRERSKSALGYARAAINADPRLSEGHVQAAVAVGLRGARMSKAKAFLTNVAGRVRDHLDDALKRDPGNVRALSISAAWRLEVARRGGGMLYRAVPEEGFDEFLKARELALADGSVAFECALRLLASKRPEWRQPALEALVVAVAAEPRTAFETEISARAHALKAAVDGGPAAEAAFIATQP